MAQKLKTKKVYKIGKTDIQELYLPSEILRDHNKPVYAKVKEAYQYARMVALVQATGTGKSFISYQWLVDNLKDGQNTLFLVPSKAIAEQHKKSIKMLGLADKLKNVKFVLYSSLSAEVEEMLKNSTTVDYIVADEFHRLGAPEWKKAYEKLLALNPTAKVLGLSATPVRFLDGERDMAKELFEETVLGINLLDAIKDRLLPAPKYVRGVISYDEHIDKLEKRVKFVKGKKAQAEVKRKINALKKNIEDAEGLEKLFGQYMTKRDGKYVLFCADLNHLESIKQKIRDGLFSKVNKNVKIYDVSYKKSVLQVKSEIDAFDKDEGDHLKLMLAVEMFNEGVHVKGLDGVVMMRKTMSPRLYLQQVGRVFYVGKITQPLVIDVMENYEGLHHYASFLKQGVYGGGQDYLYNDYDLPFAVIGRAVEIDQFVGEIEEFMYKSTGLKGWLSIAKEYFNQNQDLKIPVKEAGLYTWMLTMQRAYRENPNNKSLKFVFDSLSKMDKDWHKSRSRMNKEHQLEMLAECKKFYQMHGNLERKNMGLRLYAWFKHKRDLYLNDPTDPNWKWLFDQLSQIETNWFRDRGHGNKTYQLQMLEMSKEFCQEFGNLAVPTTIEKWLPLQNWLYERKKDYQKNNSNWQWVFDELSKIDRSWYSRDLRRGNKAFQEEKINQCQAFCQIHKNLAIPAKDAEWIEIYSWLDRRKQNYRQNPNSLTWKWVFDRLDAIDPNWHMTRSSGSDREYREEAFLEALKQFKQQYGSFKTLTKRLGATYRVGSEENFIYSKITAIRRFIKMNSRDIVNLDCIDQLIRLDDEKLILNEEYRKLYYQNYKQQDYCEENFL